MDARSAQDASSVAGSDTAKLRLQLPASCEPPHPGVHRKQLVWIVSQPSIPSSCLTWTIN